MKPIFNTVTLLIAVTLLFSTSCSDSVTGSEPDLSDSLEPVENVQPITGGENATITVNQNRTEAYFSIQFSNIKSNTVIENSTREAWCIDWMKPIDSDNGTYNNIQLYSTDLVEKWKPVNYLLNIRENLKINDPNITWREIQIVLWSLRANPEFDLNKVVVEDLPSAFRTDGQPNFSYEKVAEILTIVDNGYKDFEFSTGTKFAVIAETPADVQTVFTVVEKK